MNRTVYVVLMLALVLGFYGCAKKAEIERPSPRVQNASDLVTLVSERALLASKLDSNLKVRLSGTSRPFMGRFFGSFRVERIKEDELCLLLQLYALAGAPVLEALVSGDRLYVHSPLERTVFVNSRALAPGSDYEELPLSSFEYVALPLSLIKEQVYALFGLGFSEYYDYELVDTGDAYLLNEWDKGSLHRELEYSKPGIELKRVRVYEKGVETAGMDCSDHGAFEAPAGFMPGRIELFKGDAKMVIKLADVRVNQEVEGDTPSFEKISGHKKVILLTPPVP